MRDDLKKKVRNLLLSERASKNRQKLQKVPIYKKLVLLKFFISLKKMPTINP
jgi:hypothetical protein